MIFSYLFHGSIGAGAQLPASSSHLYNKTSKVSIVSKGTQVTLPSSHIQDFACLQSSHMRSTPLTLGLGIGKIQLLPCPLKTRLPLCNCICMSVFFHILRKTWYKSCVQSIICAYHPTPQMIVSATDSDSHVATYAS